MPLRSDLLVPIPGENPSGSYIRHDFQLGMYDRIKEARRSDDELAQGVWQHERKTADYALVLKLGQEVLAGTSKDLQIAAWITEAMVHLEGFAGLKQGLDLCCGLLQNFWQTIYPPLEDEMRAAPLNWMGTALEIPIKSVPLVRGAYNWFHYKESRTVGFEDQAKTDKEKKARAKLVAEGKVTPEIFDKAFAETPKAFYQEREKDLEGCLASMKALDALCNERFGDDAPSLGKLRIALEEVRHTVHMLLAKKRETEPDPIPVAEEPPAQPIVTGSDPQLSAAPAGTTVMASVASTAQVSNQPEAIAAIARAAAFLRKMHPYSPAPFLMLRGLRWGELRGRNKISDLKLLEAPPTELRQQIKRLALDQRWTELIEAAEAAMSLPCSRGWLDLQRFVVTACAALGSDYDSIASAICSEIRAVLQDVPELLDASLLDDTPAANAETKAWLKQVVDSAISEVSANYSADSSPEGPAPGVNTSWVAKATDPFSLAKDAMKAEQAQKAFDIMRKEIARQRTGRGKFQRTMQLVGICVEAGKDTIAQPLLDDIASAIESHKLDDWEEPEIVASALLTLMKYSKKIQGSANDRQKIFERICRLDPAQALNVG